MRYLFLNRRLAQRLNLEGLLRTIRGHLHQCRIAYLSLLLLMLTALAFRSCFSLGLNASPSLPHTLFLIHKGQQVERGQYVAFRWHGGGPYPAGTTFIKIVAGIPGDTVTQIDRQFFVIGMPVGTAKEQTRQGALLEVGPTGLIPSGQYYVKAPHPNSLDSRYRLTGWIPQTQFIGHAHALF